MPFELAISIEQCLSRLVSDHNDYEAYTSVSDMSTPMRVMGSKWIATNIFLSDFPLGRSTHMLTL